MIKSKQSYKYNYTINPNSSNTCSTIYLVRHAQPNSHALNGHLTNLGIIQAKKIAEHLSKIPELSDKNLNESQRPLIIVSPTARTRETADFICQKLNIRPIIHSAFAEEYLVDTNKNFISPAFLRNHVRVKRLMHSFNKIVNSARGRPIIVVSHGNIIRMILGKIQSMSYNQISKIEVSCASIIRIITLNNKLQRMEYTLQTDF